MTPRIVPKYAAFDVEIGGTDIFVSTYFERWNIFRILMNI
jgi:hypothetical protein